MDLSALVWLSVGLGLGTVAGILLTRARTAATIATLQAERSGAADRLAFAEQAQRQLTEQFRTLSAEALERSMQHSNAQFLELADSRLQAVGAPLQESLKRLDGRLREIETARTTAQATLAQQIEHVRATGDQLRRETASLVNALRKPQVRGQWGEMQLRRAVEVAGMLERCDFDTQITVSTYEGAQRPDMVVHLAGDKHVVVDAKVPLAAFLEAAEAADEEGRAERLRAHARHLRTHVDLLSGKAYWQRITPSPEFVVLFVPGESFLAQALDTDPALLEHAASRKVVIATPTTLIALLRTVAYAWTQDALAANAREVFELGRELYTRLGALGDHVDRLGRALTSAVGAYNKTVGSMEARVLVSARKLRDLKVVEDDLATPRQVEEIPRALSSPELTAAAEEARQVRALPTHDGTPATSTGEEPDVAAV
jgi:DNA recombination protein RmuC